MYVPSTAAKSAQRLHDLAALARRTVEGWQPLPHQIPPDGDWWGWLLMAGRGAGKTDACANAMVEHVNGPPCMPGPIPHWMALIGPTLGDAVRSGYEGPSGIRAHDPRAVKVTRDGGTVIHWPNGSEAKVFGAHSLEDTDRLRSGGNNCFVWCCSEGTLVQTNRGQVPIEDVRPGDQVWTRKGLREVKDAALTRQNAETLIISTEEDHRLELTPDHRVWVVGRGWVEAQNVTPGNGMVAFSSPPECGQSSVGAPAVRVVVVQTVEPSSIRPDTYDLEIVGEPEFFANGLLIHNCEEMAAWRYLDEAYAQMRFGLRTGAHPRWVASTTPRPRPLIKKLAQKTPRNVAVTHATTRDNPHLTPEFLEALLETYAGTSLAAQELEGLIIDQDENALWTRQQIEEFRVLPDDVPDLKKIAVGIDPSGGAGEQGIVISGRADLWTPSANKILSHGFVLDDRTCHLKPEGWGKRAVRAAVDWEADEILCETNYGGDMVISTVRSAAELLGVPIPIKKITATRGKKVRAEPVAALTAQGRWHHAGVFESLEDQMTTWHEDLDWSPDRLDASVWTAWGLKLAHLGGSGVGSIGSAAANRTITSAGA